MLAQPPVEAVLEQLPLASGLVSGLEERIERALDLDYPSDSVQRAADSLMRKLLSCLGARIASDRINLEQAGQTAEQIANDASLITRGCAMLGELVRYFEGAQVDYTAWGLVHQVEAFVGHIAQELDLPTLVLVRPRWNYNWSSYDVVNAFARAIDAFRRGNPPLDARDAEITNIIKESPHVLVLSFPSSERDNILWYATWGHEIGHFLNLSFALAENPADSVNSQERANGDTRASRQPGGDPSNEDVLQSAQGVQAEPRSENRDSDEIEAFALQLANQAEFEPSDVEELAGLRKQNANDIRENTLRRRLARELEHSLADIWSVHLLGPSALYVAGEVGAAVLRHDWRGFEEHDPHPPMWSRIELMLAELEFLKYFEWLGGKSSGGDGWDAEFEAELRSAAASKVSELRGWAQALRAVPKRGTRADQLETQLVDRARDEACSYAREAIRQVRLDSFCSAQLLNGAAFRLANLLRNDNPPTDFTTQDVDLERTSFPLIMNASWLFWLWRTATWGEARGSANEYLGYRRRTNRLVLKAFRSREAQSWFLARTSTIPKTTTIPHANDNGVPVPPPDSGVLGEAEITRRLSGATSFDERLVLNPLLDAQDQIKGAAVDIRLGNEFIVTHRMRLPAIDPMRGAADVRKAIRKYQYHVYVNFGDCFVLHPSQFALGVTLEFVGIPTDLSAVVVGRSSWGRLGLVIATATKVDPGFRGCITLELVNLGDSPLMIYPGLTIGQLLLYKMSSPSKYVGRYDIPIGPEFSRIYDDKELQIWGPGSSPLGKVEQV